MDSGALIPAAAQPLRELQPLAPAELSQQWGPGIYAPLPAQDSVLREYLRVLIKRKFVVLSVIIIIFLMVLIATLRMVPSYDAAGSIAINKLDPGLLTFKDSQGSTDYYDPADLDTEVRILKSDLLALQVIKQLNLDKRPEFGGHGNLPSPNTLPLTTDALQADSGRTTALLGMFKSSLRVTLQPNTRVIEIHYTSPNKELAATIVNTLVNTYIEQNFKTKFESTMQASDWLSKQLVDLQMKVETSQEKLVKYQKDHQILGIDEKQIITTAKLDELNKELTAAESARMEKESVFRLADGGDTESAAAVASSSSVKGSGSSSGLLDKLESTKADLKIQIAQVSTQFGPAY